MMMSGMVTWSSPVASGSGHPLLLLIGGGVLVWSNRGGSRSSVGGSRRTLGETPREILDRRLAAGEIDADEYREILREISDGGGSV